MKEWNPGYWRIKKDTLIEEFIPYEKKWYCNQNKIMILYVIEIITKEKDYGKE